MTLEQVMRANITGIKAGIDCIKHSEKKKTLIILFSVYSMRKK